MQTFLPYFQFKRSVQCLDTKRLGKQRVEAMQIIKSLENPNYGYKHHPVKRMWENHILALKYYHNCCINEWRWRGRYNTMAYYALPNVISIPVFSAELYLSHQSNLMRKDPEHYSKFFSIAPDLPYEWTSPIGSQLVNIGEIK
jgi:hypothetical protein